MYKYIYITKYTFIKRSGPQHKTIFKKEVEIPQSKKINGIGSSKKNKGILDLQKIIYKLSTKNEI